jgi:hypothetical protein
MVEDWLKLMNSLPGPLMAVSDDPLVRDVRAKPNESKAQLTKQVVESFGSLATPPIHASLDVNTDMGFACDVVCLMDGAGKPLAMAKHNLIEPGNPVAGAQK